MKKKEEEALHRKLQRKPVRRTKLESLALSTSKTSFAVIKFAEKLSNLEPASPVRSKYSPKPLRRNTPDVTWN